MVRARGGPRAMKYGYARVSPGNKSESVDAQARQHEAPPDRSRVRFQASKPGYQTMVIKVPRMAAAR